MTQALPSIQIGRRVFRPHTATIPVRGSRYRITKVGDGETRTALFEAANVILRPTTRWSSIKAWAMKIAVRQGARRAKVALARRMAVTLHRMWVDEQDFRWSAA